MKILSISMQNKFLDWKFEQIDFKNNLSLLVGISGAGKTQILRGIETLKDITNGHAINGLSWNIEFEVRNKTYYWSGEFSTIQGGVNNYKVSEDDDRKKPILLREKVIDKNQTTLIEKEQDRAYFNTIKLPKLSSHQSLIYVLKEEHEIAKIYNAINKIIYRNHTTSGSVFFRRSEIPFQELQSNLTTLNEIKNSDEDIRVKLYLSSIHKLSVFTLIKNNFINIFPEVEDIKIDFLTKESDVSIKDFLELLPFISIKDSFSKKWILEDRMSSGMLRVLIHLSEIYLSPKGAVILIDEFENSLGVNCIDILTDSLLHDAKDLQFIATSHHPYIINNIPYEYWKIVTRKGGDIKVYDAFEFNLGKSKQKAFLQLTKILENSTLPV